MYHMYFIWLSLIWLYSPWGQFTCRFVFINPNLGLHLTKYLLRWSKWLGLEQIIQLRKEEYETGRCCLSQYCSIQVKIPLCPCGDREESKNKSQGTASHFLSPRPALWLYHVLTQQTAVSTSSYFSMDERLI